MFTLKKYIINLFSVKSILKAFPGNTATVKETFKKINLVIYSAPGMT